MMRVRSLSISRALLPVLALLSLSVSSASAQSPLLRDFEEHFFVERLIQIERAYHQADEARRIAAHKALLEQRRWIGVASGASHRARALARVFALLKGRAADDEGTLSRFDSMLYALPEVVDAQKTVGDRRRFFAMSGFARNPRDTAPEDQLEPGADRIFMTGRGVFGLRKPDDLLFRMSVRDAAGGRILASKERGDVENPRGWLAHALSVSFDTSELLRADGQDAPQTSRGWRSFHAELEMRVDGSWPKEDGLRSVVPFHIAPGYLQATLQFLEQRAALLQKVHLDPVLRAALEVRSIEACRVQLGDPAPLESWPCQALLEARELLDLARKGRPMSAPGSSGEEFHGVPSAGGSYATWRVVWKRDREGKLPRVSLVVAPRGFGVHWARSELGLGLSAEQLLGGKPGLVAFAPARGLGYVQTILQRRFGVAPEQLRLIGVLEGGVGARFALHELRGPIAEFALVGGELPSDNELRGKARRYSVYRAWGLPTDERLEAIPPMRERLGKEWPERGVELHTRAASSLTEALLQALAQG
jgi:hypothetical protein